MLVLNSYGISKSEFTASGSVFFAAVASDHAFQWLYSMIPSLERVTGSFTPLSPSVSCYEFLLAFPLPYASISIPNYLQNRQQTAFSLQKHTITQIHNSDQPQKPWTSSTTSPDLSHLRSHLLLSLHAPILHNRRELYAHLPRCLLHPHAALSNKPLYPSLPYLTLPTLSPNHPPHSHRPAPTSRPPFHPRPPADHSAATASSPGPTRPYKCYVSSPTLLRKTSPTPPTQWHPRS